ncbi:beta-lactamase [Candidatus Magnetomorum sp. HK-1]|nr:beta-lactamase [Candidatus Magnetomorum sp. HK-1]
MINDIDKAMTSAISNGVFHGASLHVSIHHQRVYAKNFGVTCREKGQKINDTTVFDLASLTKPLATSLSIMHMIQRGTLSLDQTLADIFPEATQKDKANISVQHLLCHNSGLPDHRPYYETLKNVPEVERSGFLLNQILNEPLIQKPGKKTVYSDLGFMLLESAIKRISGIRLDEYIKKNIYLPLGLKDLFFIDLFKSHHLQTENFAATEICPWRNKTLIAQVHDDNAYVLGGICGHAGLFGTIENVYKLLDYLLTIYHGRSGTLSQKILHQKWIRTFFHVPKKAQRALGFDVPTPPKSSSGKFFSKNSVGHLGFTGTSFWMDLDQSIIIILLTNRVHPNRNNIKIRQFRPFLHDIIMQWLLSEKQTNSL